MDAKVETEADVEKQRYITENIIAKGYNVEEFDSFLSARRGSKLSRIPLDLLKKELDYYKNQQLKESIMKSASKTGKLEPLDELYTEENIDITTESQTTCKLKDFENEKIKITIKISEGKFEKAGFFGGMKFLCTLSCEELGSKVNRTFEDFEWLKNQLNEKYPFIYVPPLPPKNKNDTIDLKERYLNKFLKTVLRKKILRTSELLEKFLTLNDSDFNKYKEANKVTNLDIDMEKYKTMKEFYKVDFKKDQIYLPEKYIKRIEPSNNLYNSLKKTIELIIQDFSNLNKHMKELGSTFANLQKSSRDTNQDENVKTSYDKLKNIFNNWSNACEKQKNYFEKDFYELFNYISLEVNELNVIEKKFANIKKNYETKGLDYLNKREKLFNSKNFAKWELTEEDNKNLNEFKDDFDEAKKYICKSTGEYVSKQKMVVACGCNILMKEFNKVSKYIGEQLKEYFDETKGKNPDLVADYLNVVKLLDVKIEN